jgi:hypothetical protein
MYLITCSISWDRKYCKFCGKTKILVRENIKLPPPVSHIQELLEEMLKYVQSKDTTTYATINGSKFRAIVKGFQKWQYWPEMESASLLPKAWSRYYTDACIFKQLECIEYISTLTQGLCLLNSFPWDIKLKQTISVIKNEGFLARWVELWKSQHRFHSAFDFSRLGQMPWQEPSRSAKH